MERICKIALKNRGNFIGVTITYIISTITNVMSAQIYSDPYEILKGLIAFNNFSVLIMWLLIVFTLFILFFSKIMSDLIERNGINIKFAELMNRNTDSVFDEVENFPGFSWGKNKTLVHCKNIVEGWKADAIKVTDYDKLLYTVTDEKKEYEKYCGSSEFIKTMAAGNNLPTVMVSGYKMNYDKNSPRLLLELKRTEWSQTSFFWKKCGEDDNYLKEQVKKHFNKDGPIQPHSFCLHLIVETSDRKIALGKISKNKFNDYPNTEAATIGEQIEIEDFLVEGKDDFNDNFVVAWVKRAFLEEFGISSDQYNDLVNESMIRVLGLNFEGDIYNISLATIVRINYSAENFKKELSKTFDEKEIIELRFIGYDEILEILLNYDTNKLQYHSSTYLRLLLTYLHRYGKKRTYSDLLSKQRARCSFK